MLSDYKDLTLSLGLRGAVYLCRMSVTQLGGSRNVTGFKMVRDPLFLLISEDEDFFFSCTVQNCSKAKTEVLKVNQIIVYKYFDFRTIKTFN